MNVVNSYMYLGFTFTTGLSDIEGTDFLKQRARRLFFLLCTAFVRLKNRTKVFEVFDIKIQPMLMCAS